MCICVCICVCVHVCVRAVCVYEALDYFFVFTMKIAGIVTKWLQSLDLVEVK